MALHLIPDDGSPHAPTSECGCGVRPLLIGRVDGTVRRALAHGVDLDDDEHDQIASHVFQLNPEFRWTEVDIDRDGGALCPP